MRYNTQLGLEHILFERLKTLCHDYVESGNPQLLENGKGVIKDAEQFMGEYRLVHLLRDNQSIQDFEEYIGNMLDSLGKQVWEIEEASIQTPERVKEHFMEELSRLPRHTVRDYHRAGKLPKAGIKAMRKQIAAQDAIYKEQFKEKAGQTLRVGEFLAFISGDEVYAFDFLSDKLKKYGLEPFVPEEVVSQAVASYAMKTSQMVVSRDPQRDFLAGNFR